MRRPDYGRPLINFRLLQSAECFWALLPAWRHLITELGQLLPHGRVGQGTDSCGVDLANNVLRCASGYPKPKPVGDMEFGQSSLVSGRDSELQQAPARDSHDLVPIFGR